MGKVKLDGIIRSDNFGRILASMDHNVTRVSMSQYSKLKVMAAVRDGMEIMETPDPLWGRAGPRWHPWDTIWRLMYLTFGRTAKFYLVHGFECRPVAIFPILSVKKKHRDLVFVSDWGA
jgi:hypothetical protein